MAAVVPSTEYVVRFTADEFRLVGLALSGLLKPSQVREALELNLRMLENKNRHLDELLKVSRGAAERAKEALASIVSADTPEEA